MAELAENAGDKREAARENWRRVNALWSWLGRNESDKQLILLLSRYARGAPLQALERARLGDERGGGQMRPKSAQALVGPLLGVDYLKEEGRGISQLNGYQGPAVPALLAHLRALPPQAHVDLGDHWVAFVRCIRPDPPAPWQPSEPTARAVPVASAPVASAPVASAPVVNEPAASSQQRGAIVSAEAPTVLASVPSVQRPASQPAAPIATRSRAPLGYALAALAVLALVGLAFFTRSTGARAPADVTARAPAAPAPQAQTPPDQQNAAAPSAAPSAARAASEAGAEIPVRMAIEAERAGSRFELRNGGTLHSGDRFSFSVQCNEPVFVSLLVLRSDRKPEVIYPVGRDVQLQAGPSYRIPEARDGALELDDELGTERMLLLTTTAPLSPSRAELPALLQRVKARSGWPNDWPAPDATFGGSAPTPATRGATTTTVHTRGVLLRPPAAEAARSNERIALVTAHFVTLEHLE